MHFSSQGEGELEVPKILCGNFDPFMSKIGTMSETDSNPRVLIVSSYGPPHPGGLERAVARIFEESKRRGVDIRWLLSDVPELPEQPDTIRVKVWNQLDTKLRLAIPVPKLSAYKRLYEEISKCDVVHLHDGYYLICFAAALMAKLQGKKSVLTVHIWDVPYKNPLIQLMQKGAFGLMVTPTVWMVDSIVSYNRQIYKKLEDRRANPRYIANGVDPSFGKGRVPVPVAELREKLGLPLDKKIVIFAGRYSLKKGLSVVEEAIRNLPEVFFVMCGTGPVSPEDWKLPNLVNFGWVNAEKLRSLFSCVDLFLLPSRGEGFPLAIQEAMSQGLACAVYGETWESLDDVRDYFLILDDFSSPAEAIRSFLARPESENKSAEIAAYTQSHWNVDAMSKAYLQVYQDACSTSPKVMAPALK
jgi:glycosyltransferase involved in cell wall biosynthesis